ncbi:MAG: cytochrome c-type biogenesis protein CcmH [Candidatus Latescibacterota bacterium]|nr:cytochrome c-type biogenesis protein CcmH [Candidatus Latescibacterota bacterium]
MATLSALYLVLALSSGVQAQSGYGRTETDVAAGGLFTSLMSPYCPGSLLNECPSNQAAVLRDSIRTWLVSGRSSEQIRDHLVATFGQEILASPPYEGAGVFAWWGPIVIAILGLAAAGWCLYRRTQTTPPTPTTTSDDELTRRLHRELTQGE